MQLNEKKDNLYIVFISGCLIILQSILLIQTRDYWLILFLFLLQLLFSLIFFYFWFHYIKPDSAFSQIISWWRYSIIGKLNNKRFFLTVSEGKIIQDYFILQNKPKREVIFVHPNSAAISVLPDDEFRYLVSGFHEINQSERIIASFDLRYQNFIYGPQNEEDPFINRKSGESFTRFHARQLRAQKVKSFTKDSAEVYPSFHICYRLAINNDTGQVIDQDLTRQIVQYLQKNNLSGEASPIINEIIGEQVFRLWSNQVKNSTLNQLLSDNQHQNLSHIIQEINRELSRENRQSNPTNLNPHGNKMTRISDDISEWVIPFIRIHLNNLWVEPKNSLAPNQIGNE